MRRRTLLRALAAAPLLAPVSVIAQARPPIRVATLNFGTVNWEIDVIRRHGLDASHGVVLEPLVLADKDAAAVALLAGSADAIVTDWLWVSRQRADGADFTFVSHSLAVGGVMADPAQGLKTVADLKGRKLGVAGGATDKSWLLLRAYAIETMGADLAELAEPVFGAPPLLNELLVSGEIDAVLNFWQFNAQLAGRGMVEIIAIRDILPALGIAKPPPLLGWVFSDAWAADAPDAVRGLLQASVDAKRMLASDDAEWQAVRPLMRAADDATFEALVAGYRAGIPAHYGPADIAGAERAYAVMAAIGGRDLTGGHATLAPGTFWSGFTF
jgi:NitT/TauT family transport system substrate-binding protein